MRRSSGFSPPPRGPASSGFSRDARSPAVQALGGPRRGAGGGADKADKRKKKKHKASSTFSDGPATKRLRPAHDDGDAAPKRPLPAHDDGDADDAAARARATLRDLQAKLRAPAPPRHGAVITAPAPPKLTAAEAAQRARESLERTVADAALDAAIADTLAGATTKDAPAPAAAAPTEAELLWAPLNAGEAEADDDWRALAPDGASPELLAALEAANNLKAAARRMGAPQSRQAALQSLAALKRLAPELLRTDLDRDLGLRDVLGDLKISSDRIVAGAARGLRAAWRERAAATAEVVAERPKPAPTPPKPTLPADTDITRLQRRVAGLEADLAAARQALAMERVDAEAARNKLRQSFTDLRKKWARDETELRSQRDAATQRALTATDRAKRALELDRAALANEPRVCDRCRRPVAAPNPQRGGARTAKKASDRFTRR
jgi:hypothetical protein